MRIQFKEFSFGATSAIITSLAIIVGLSKTASAQITIISALLIIAVADNISDTFGIHIHQECQCENKKEVRRIVIYNFLVRFVIVLVFILFIALIPMDFAVILSILLGAVILIMISYFIAIKQKTRPWKSIVNHLLLALVVILVSFFLREFISDIMIKFLKNRSYYI